MSDKPTLQECIDQIDASLRWTKIGSPFPVSRKGLRAIKSQLISGRECAKVCDEIAHHLFTQQDYSRVRGMAKEAVADAIKAGILGEKE